MISQQYTIDEYLGNLAHWCSLAGRPTTRARHDLYARTPPTTWAGSGCAHRGRVSGVSSVRLGRDLPPRCPNDVGHGGAPPRGIRSVAVRPDDFSSSTPSTRTWAVALHWRERSSGPSSDQVETISQQYALDEYLDGRSREGEAGIATGLRDLPSSMPSVSTWTADGRSGEVGTWVQQPDRARDMLSGCPVTWPGSRCANRRGAGIRGQRRPSQTQSPRLEHGAGRSCAPARPGAPSSMPSTRTWAADRRTNKA